MDSQQFREFGKAMVDYIADYLENIRDRYFNLLFQIYSKLKSSRQLKSSRHEAIDNFECTKIVQHFLETFLNNYDK